MLDADIITAVNTGAYSSKLPYHSRKDDDIAWSKYNEDDARLRAKLIKDLSNSESFSGLNPAKFDIIFSKAWESGHSSGLYQVVFDFIDLCAFVKEFLK